MSERYVGGAPAMSGTAVMERSGRMRQLLMTAQKLCSVAQEIESDARDEVDRLIGAQPSPRDDDEGPPNKVTIAPGEVASLDNTLGALATMLARISSQVTRLRGL